MRQKPNSKQWRYAVSKGFSITDMSRKSEPPKWHIRPNHTKVFKIGIRLFRDQQFNLKKTSFSIVPACSHLQKHWKSSWYWSEQYTSLVSGHYDSRHIPGGITGILCHMNIVNNCFIISNQEFKLRNVNLMKKNRESFKW